MTTSSAGVSAVQRLEAKHRAMWPSRDYLGIAAELISELGPELVEAGGIRAGQRVLCVAAGAGNGVLSAAAIGPEVVASDLAPGLLERGRRTAVERGLAVEWVEAEAEALPFPTGGFDAVISCVGAMLAPHHRATADELLRVCRPGGTITLVNWTPEGFIGGLFATLARFAPLPPGAQPPLLWGRGEQVRELFGDGVTRLAVRRRITVFDQCATPLEFREYWKRTYGPTIAVYAANPGDPERVAALDSAFLEFLESWNVAPVGRPARWEAQYLLVTATRA
ncbi:class I SAM-dependent methyltransferase [Pseudonocardia sp. DSM 110487]|uniref:class I SAM-dependent methyltransferase n=1 Tax=Pseudonocardia sp. DSM 110487 TaxID=2865833 RepID=UPI001C69CDB0|nr:class I SAM-dependent methyltransferase [Pseudonocardia sp. DSM 110487]QYN38716.1 class I SAM-dependent methyltransferase [Pseudonocardia sp. DSM 110487]